MLSYNTSVCDMVMVDSWVGLTQMTLWTPFYPPLALYSSLWDSYIIRQVVANTILFRLNLSERE